MDKRKLYKDVARVKKQLFAATAFTGFLLVTLTTLITQGNNFFLVFRNASISILFFGFLGYVWSRIYEKTTEGPLVESYRMEAMERIEDLKSSGGKMVALDVATSELSAGMKVINEVKSSEGASLVRKGAILNDRMITVLKEHNIQQIKVEARHG